MKFIIYVIKNIITNKFYVGSTSQDLYSIRKSNHFNTLKRNKHHSFKLQNSYNKYGKENFEMFIIDTVIGTLDDRCLLETDCIAKYNSYKKGYNCTNNATGSGKTHSIQTKKQMSNRMKEEFRLGIRKPPNPKGEKRDEKLMNYKNNLKKIPILQYDLEGQLIKEYKSASDAFKETGYSRTQIANNLKKRCKTAFRIIYGNKKEDYSIFRKNG